MVERADQLNEPEYEDDALADGDAEILQTRQEMSETLEAIQQKLAPERLTDDAKDAARETVDHVVEEAKEAAQEWSEIASVAAMEAVDHAMSKIKETFPELSQQAQGAASQAVDHAIEEARQPFGNWVNRHAPRCAMPPSEGLNAWLTRQAKHQST